jgi:hypothetical protein
MAAKSTQKSIAIIVPPKTQSLDVSGPLDAFLDANRHSSGGALYEVRLIAIGAGRTIKVGGMSAVADCSISDHVGPIDTMLVAGTPDYAAPLRVRICTHGCAASLRGHGDTARFAPVRSFSVRRASSKD